MNFSHVKGRFPLLYQYQFLFVFLAEQIEEEEETFFLFYYDIMFNGLQLMNLIIYIIF